MSTIAFALVVMVLSLGVTSALAQTLDDEGSRIVSETASAPQLDRPRPPDHRRRASAAEVLKGQPLPSTFDDLAGFLVPGHEVVVRDATGRKKRGWMSTLSGDQIVIFTQGASPFLRLFSPPQELMFPADSVTRIDIVDSTANGVLLGVVAGAGIMTALVQANKEELRTSNLAPAGYALLSVVSFAPSIYVGQLIDKMKNKPIYERRFRASRVALAPFVAGHTAGVMARVQIGRAY
jgi:hypothetical protein